MLIFANTCINIALQHYSKKIKKKLINEGALNKRNVYCCSIIVLLSYFIQLAYAKSISIVYIMFSSSFCMFW